MSAVAASSLAMIAALALPGIAQAASNHAISGETWSSNSEWYTSATYRTKVGDGNVKISFTKLPRFSDGDYDDLKWRYIDNAGSILGGSHYTFSSVGTTYTNWYMWDGNQFRNSFARGTACFSGCDHTFSGTQNY
ncbi:hypothetical protein [Micromonospora carbonacea]|uniref:hypothetical protein n=1 Tax=Micromonospora carbonacea TaxID=47853 RepID=UPI0009450837